MLAWIIGLYVLNPSQILLSNFLIDIDPVINSEDYPN